MSSVGSSSLSSGFSGEEHVNGGGPVEAFGILMNQASTDLNRYIAVTETRGTQPSEADPETDADWSEHVTLEIGPHPNLSDTQQKVIVLDYDMRGGKAKIPVRRAPVYYALKRHGLDTDPAARRPKDQQIVLLNAAELGPVTIAASTPNAMGG